MSGSSGLQYVENSALGSVGSHAATATVGVGSHAATATVGVPSFAREVKDKGLRAKPAVFHFDFKLKGGLLTEVSEPTAAAN